MKKHNLYITEWKNVSDDVIRLSKMLASRIYKHSQTVPRKISKVNKKVYLTGSFTFDVDKCFNDINKFGINELNVEYVLYLVDSLQEYNNLISDGDIAANSSFSDFEKQHLTIVSGIIGGYMSPDFMEDIMHEVNHIFEYGNGREKKVGLYDKSIELAQQGDGLQTIVGKLVYMSFPHEIDAFVHQFYGFLMQNNPEGDFDTLLKYSMYYKMEGLRYRLNAEMFDGDNEINVGLHKLGITREQFNKRIHYAITKFKRKLWNAYRRYKIEHPSRGTMESLIKRDNVQFMIFEEYKKRYNDIEWSFEPFYNFLTY